MIENKLLPLMEACIAVGKLAKHYEDFAELAQKDGPVWQFDRAFIISGNLHRVGIELQQRMRAGPMATIKATDLEIMTTEAIAKGHSLFSGMKHKP